MKVQFLQTRTVQAAGGETFNQGEIYDLPEPSAARWLQRGVAKAVSDAEAEAIEAAAKAPVKKAKAGDKKSADKDGDKESA